MSRTLPTARVPHRTGKTRRCAPSECLRVYRCGPCQTLVTVCRACDHGQLYCGPACRQQQRGLQLRAAGRRYQQQERGRLLHAARQRAYWARQRCAQPSGPPLAPAHADAATCAPPEQTQPAAVPCVPAVGLSVRAMDTARRIPMASPRANSSVSNSRPHPPGPQPRCCVCERPSNWWISRFRVTKRHRRRAR